VLFDADRKGPRRCGDCQLCCKLLPVQTLAKKASERCRHQKAGKGCAVYRRPGFPPECHFWSCRWLLHESGTESMRRPDRAHYCIDMMPDYITIIHNETGARTRWEVVQIWCDPGYRDAHCDPALRAFLEAKRIPGIVRFSETDALHLIPPSRSDDNQWHEVTGAMRETTHTPAQIAAAIGVHTQVVINE
jgi:hypothetical protein